ncbi:unnamed protein product, partial [Phaeothamnion confervicola]
FLRALTNGARGGNVLVCYGSSSSGGGGGDSGRGGGGGSECSEAVGTSGGSGGGGDDGEPYFKFIMLNPSVHFADILREARAVVLVGGTMRPVAPLVKQLFPDTPRDRLELFSCGHVVPPENLLPLCVARGPSGVQFDFTFRQRATDIQIAELGRLLNNVCTVVPGGVVVFLASYGYLEEVLKRWKASGQLAQLNARKKVFCEPRAARDVDRVLADYSVGGGGGWGPLKKGGALLLSVVGAKMSEGINFADDMARCVVMVGLPYPDSRDPELRQRMAYLDRATGAGAGREYYQSICMRAVNQSIGRSIRH